MTTIKAGDLAIIVHDHCKEERVGFVDRIVEVGSATGLECVICGEGVDGPFGFYDDGSAHPLRWLKKIPPLEELEGEREYVYIKSPQDIPA